MNRKALYNLIWLFSDKILRLALGVFVIVYVTNYLGPHRFGAFSYSLSIVSIALCLASLGLKSIVVKFILDLAHNSRVIVGTSFLLQFIFSLVSYLFLFIYVSNFESDREFLILVMGLALLFKPSDSLRYYFEANLRSKYSVKVDLFVFLVSSFLKVYLVLNESTLVTFALIFLFESILSFICFSILYYKEFKMLRVNFDFQLATTLLSKSWPLLISSASWIIYTKLDQLMIGKLLNDSAVGYYAAAAQLSDVIVFIPTIITASLIPLTVKYRSIDLDVYFSKFQLIYDISVGTMLVVSIVVSVFSPRIIYLLYGEEFSTSSSILVVHIWSTVFMSMAVISGQYLIYENKQKIVMYRHTLGIFINALLNFILIPIYGVEGAAYATLLSLVVCNYFLDLLSSATRVCFIQKSRVIFLSGIRNAYKRSY